MMVLLLQFDKHSYIKINLKYLVLVTDNNVIPLTLMGLLLVKSHWSYSNIIGKNVTFLLKFSFVVIIKIDF